MVKYVRDGVGLEMNVYLVKNLGFRYMYMIFKTWLAVAIHNNKITK